MLEYDFDESIAYWVCMTSRALEQAINEELAPHGITFRQWQVLGWLALEGDMNQVTLADRLRVEAPTLVGILDRMERDGWISRQADTRDRRQKIISTTPRVQPVWETITAAARRVRARAARGLTEEELALLRKVMRTVQENLRQPEPVEGTVR